MADYEVKLRVDSDAEDAKKDLDDIEAKGQRVKRSLGGGGGGGGKGPRATGREMGDELGKVAGKAIGKAIAGFIAHQVSGLVFEGMRTVGGDNTNVNRAESTVGGALQGGTMGAMVGGPWGAAIGAVLGGVTGLIGEIQKEQRQMENVKVSMRMSAWQAGEGATSGIGKTALNALLDRSWTGNGGRGEILRGQAVDLQREYKAAAARLEEAAGWDHESTAFKMRQADYTRTQQAFYSAATDYANERINTIGNASPYEASEFGDSFSSRGMYVGPQVNAAEVNDVLGDRMQEQINLLRELVNISNAGAGHQLERLQEMINKLDRLSL